MKTYGIKSQRYFRAIHTNPKSSHETPHPEHHTPHTQNNQPNMNTPTENINTQPKNIKQNQTPNKNMKDPLTDQILPPKKITYNPLKPLSTNTNKKNFHFDATTTTTQIKDQQSRTN